MLAAKMKHVNNTILAIIVMVDYIHNQLVNVIKWVMDQMSFKDKSTIQALIVTKKTYSPNGYQLSSSHYHSLT